MDGPGADDNRLGREPALGPDDGRVRPGLRVSVRDSRNRVLRADLARVGGARIGLEGRRLQLGHRGDLRADGAAGDLVPVRDDDLLLPGAAGLRREHDRLHHQSRPGQQRRLHGRDHRRAVLGQRARLLTRGGTDRQARVRRNRDRNTDPRRDPRRDGGRIPASGQPLSRADERPPSAARLDRAGRPRADRKQLPRLLRHGDERGARR